MIAAVPFTVILVGLCASLCIAPLRDGVRRGGERDNDEGRTEGPGERSRRGRSLARGSVGQEAGQRGGGGHDHR